MIVEREYYVKLSEIGKENKITNKALLGILEDIGGVHSNIAGYGIPTMDKTHLTWILLDWKVQVIRRPNYAEKILARTWSKDGLKYYAYRDFEVVDEQGNVIVKAISRWVLVNIETGKMERITDEILSKYQPESNKCVFEDETFDKIKELAVEMGYAGEVKEFKANPGMYKAHVGDVSTVLRVALTARTNTPDMYEIMQVLGKNRIAKRLEVAKENLK
jgi:medium-chain acyl-[acyl-carrier-protein] hydrolase